MNYDASDEKFKEIDENFSKEEGFENINSISIFSEKFGDYDPNESNVQSENKSLSNFGCSNMQSYYNGNVNNVGDLNFNDDEFIENINKFK